MSATPTGTPSSPKTTVTTTTTTPDGERRVIPAAGPTRASGVRTPVPAAQRCQALASADDHGPCLRWFTARVKVNGRKVRVCAQHQTSAARGTLVLFKPTAKETAGAAAETLGAR